MRLTPADFLYLLSIGKTEKELNKTESGFIDPQELKKLTSKKYGHTYASAIEHLQTDYSDGFTICSCCGSYYYLGAGFTKHLSNGCLHCEGEGKHYCYHVNSSISKHGEYPARDMCVMFDDAIHYCKDKLQVEKFKKEIEILKDKTPITK